MPQRPLSGCLRMWELGDRVAGAQVLAATGQAGWLAGNSRWRCRQWLARPSLLSPFLVALMHIQYSVLLILSMILRSLSLYELLFWYLARKVDVSLATILNKMNNDANSCLHLAVQYRHIKVGALIKRCTIPALENYLKRVTNNTSAMKIHLLFKIHNPKFKI